MEASELTRAVVGLPAAAIVPALVPVTRGRVARTLAAVGLGAWAVAPALDRWEGWTALTLAVLGSHAIHLKRDASTDPPLWRVVAAAVAAAGAAALLLDAKRSIEGLDSGAQSGDAVVVSAGALVAVFFGGALIIRLLAPFEERIQNAASVSGEGEAPGASEDLARAGLYIGWLERVLLYAFVVAGAPGAVAAVVAVKSIARFPSFTKEKFAEYFLIGTLASVLIAVGVGIAVRAVLGLSPLLP